MASSRHPYVIYYMHTLHARLHSCWMRLICSARIHVQLSSAEPERSRISVMIQHLAYTHIFWIFTYWILCDVTSIETPVTGIQNIFFKIVYLPNKMSICSIYHSGLNKIKKIHLKNSKVDFFFFFFFLFLQREPPKDMVTVKYCIDRSGFWENSFTRDRTTDHFGHFSVFL